MSNIDCVSFLQWALPQLNMRWPGFRRVRRQVCRRIQKRIVQLELPSIDAYRSYLIAHPEEWPILDRCCWVTVSRFYRDRGVFDRLFRDVLPETARLALDAGEKMVSCWSVGCASGEEAYTLVIGWKMLWSLHFPSLTLDVVATDIDPDLLNRARTGCYTAGSLKELPETWRDSAFEQSGKKWFLKSKYQNSVAFHQEDIRIIMPAGSFHLILCRNLVFTYFDVGLQQEILNRLKQHLVPGGVLVIGCHETLPDELNLNGKGECVYY
ncbi:MAG: hypothetical protein KAQ97_01315, partial [Candidatus Fermentibacteraceae bacterium]|nr:hypothetical protein [Candidatus Fermentibacteraceae bacterium]